MLWSKGGLLQAVGGVLHDAGETHTSCAGSLTSAGTKKSIPSRNPGMFLFVNTQCLLVGNGAYCRMEALARQLLPPSCPFLTQDNSGKKPKECKTCGFRYRNCKRMWSHPVCCTSQLSINESSLLKSLGMG